METGSGSERVSVTIEYLLFSRPGPRNPFSYPAASRAVEYTCLRWSSITSRSDTHKGRYKTSDNTNDTTTARPTVHGNAVKSSWGKILLRSSSVAQAPKVRLPPDEKGERAEA